MGVRIHGELINTIKVRDAEETNRVSVHWQGAGMGRKRTLYTLESAWASFIKQRAVDQGGGKGVLTAKGSSAA